jgi:hypothetical protein
MIHRVNHPKKSSENQRRLLLCDQSYQSLLDQPASKSKSNPDGSVDLYIQKDSRGADKESNWLPAPAGKFILMLRTYWPEETAPSILDGTWTIPPVKKV